MIGEDRDVARIGRHVDAHPWIAIGVATAAGAAIALVPGGIRRVRGGGRVARTLGEAALALVGAIAARVVRDYAIDAIAGVARKWTQRPETSELRSARTAHRGARRQRRLPSM